jgi:hypothetical protein
LSPALPKFATTLSILIWNLTSAALVLSTVALLIAYRTSFRPVASVGLLGVVGAPSLAAWYPRMDVALWQPTHPESSSCAPPRWKEVVPVVPPVAKSTLKWQAPHARRDGRFLKLS